MYRTIVVPLDGSTLGERALPVASALAKAMGARLVLVRAAWVSTLPGYDPSEDQVRAVNEAEQYLSGVVSRLAEQSVGAEAAVPYDHPAEGILIEIALHHADVVVMSTHGRSGLGRVVYGSVAEAVLTKSPVPVLLVRGAAPEVPLVPDGGRPRFLVPLDGSTFAEAALPHAIGLARALDGTLLVLRALNPPASRAPELTYMAPIVEPEAMAQERAEAEAYLNGIVDALKGEGVRAQAVVRQGPAAEAIVEEGRAAGVSLVVMATHGRTGLGRLLFGSVAVAVLHRGDQALMLVRPVGLVEDEAAGQHTTAGAK